MRVLRRAAELLGYACLSVRHLIDPEVIVLGGGVIEACGDFMVPIAQADRGGRPAAGRPEGRARSSARPWATTPSCWARWPWPASTWAATRS